VTKEGYNDFSFRLHGHKHTFQAATHAERDSWLVAVETKAAEAKTSRDGITGSDGYKHHMENLGRPHDDCYFVVPSIRGGESLQ